jgi:Repeat of unknown function (DUF346)
MYHKAWDGRDWFPSHEDWEPLGGVFNSPPAAVSWGENRLDIFGLGTDNRMYHKAWNGSDWDPRSLEHWDPLSGIYNSQPAVVSWDKNRLDIFCLGQDNRMYHRAWDGVNNRWDPPKESDPSLLGGEFNSAPTAVAVGAQRLHIFGLGTNNAMFYKWYGVNLLGARIWNPSGDNDWDPSLGGKFNPF